MTYLDILTSIALGLIVFASSFAIDLANTNFVQQVQNRNAFSAAMWSVVQWGASVVGFVIAIKISFWYLPIEALGLATGTYYAMRGNTEPPPAVQAAWTQTPRQIGFDPDRVATHGKTDR